MDKETVKIINTEAVHYPPEVKARLSMIGEVDEKEIEQSELLEIIENYDIIVVRLGLLMNKEVIDRAKNLKFIVSATTGLDHMDVKYIEEKGIEIISLKGEKEFLKKVPGTAELTLGLLINVARRIPQAHNAVISDEWTKKGKWLREKYEGIELIDKTIGIVGFGRLGMLMAGYAKALGMKVITHDPYIDDEIFSKEQVENKSLDELLRASDFVSLHLNLTDETENLINKDSFVAMKKSAYLLNSSRGKIVNEDDLLWALENKEITGAATDVLADELSFGTPEMPKDKLIEYAKKNDNLIIVPHIGGMTIESAAKTRSFIVDKLEQALKK